MQPYYVYTKVLNCNTLRYSIIILVLAPIEGLFCILKYWVTKVKFLFYFYTIWSLSDRTKDCRKYFN